MNRVNLKQLDNLKISIGCNAKNEILNADIKQPNLDEFIGMDIRDLGQEIVWDLLDGMPVPDNSCVYLWASHILEHIGADEIEDVMDEFWRILKKDGILEIRSPDVLSSVSLNPTHKQQLSKHYFYHFTAPNINEYGHKQWEVLESDVYDRSGGKYDVRVIMKPVK